MSTESSAPDSETGDLDHEVTAPRASNGREWELFVSEDATDPPRHAGSVTAPSREVAVEQAERLVGRDAETLWVCPADEVARRTTANVRLANR
ncbi:Htur_1727 family rSAM-partnered candidate RiPP [Halobacteria archaeon HArc-gm2]|nr:Htur_1727 family rSAM-partnered candidate RiPP [Halobacteria archaeon HArc-gm2]